MLNNRLSKGRFTWINRLSEKRRLFHACDIFGGYGLPVIAGVLRQQCQERPVGRSALCPPPEYRGAIDRRVTQENIHSTIRVAGYTAGMRPSATYTNRIKMERMKEQGLPGQVSDYELDHFVPQHDVVQDSWPFPAVRHGHMNAIPKVSQIPLDGLSKLSYILPSFGNNA